MTQTRFAEVAGISLSTISRAVKWEDVDNKEETYIAIAKGLGMSVQALDAEWNGTESAPSPIGSEEKEEPMVTKKSIWEILELARQMPLEDLEELQEHIEVLRRRAQKARKPASARTVGAAD